jgi:hypothetical protein
VLRHADVLRLLGDERLASGYAALGEGASGRVAGQLLERRLYRELGFGSFEAYVMERIDLSPRTARRRLFLAMVARMGLEGLLDHAIATWISLAKPGHEIFERDRWLCTAPACSARRNLHRHHIVYRSHEGRDDAWNLTTLCAWHHQHGAHGTGLEIRGLAADDLVFELPVGRFRSGDRKVAD